VLIMTASRRGKKDPLIGKEGWRENQSTSGAGTVTSVPGGLNRQQIIVGKS